MSYASPRRAIAEREYQEKRRRNARLRRSALGIIAGALLLVAVLAITADRLLWPDGFPIAEVYLEGEFNHVDPVTLRRKIVQALDGNFFTVDLARLEAAAEALPWIYHATVRRIWPHGVRVVVEEQRPVAQWHADAWLNIDGEVVELGEFARKSELPRLSGPDHSAPVVLARYREWQARFSASGLVVRELHMSDRHAWRLGLYDPAAQRQFDLVLGRRDLAARVRRFDRFYQQLSNDQKQPLVRVDARYPNGVAVVSTPQPESSTHGSKKDNKA